MQDYPSCKIIWLQIGGTGCVHLKSLSQWFLNLQSDYLYNNHMNVVKRSSDPLKNIPRNDGACISAESNRTVTISKPSSTLKLLFLFSKRLFMASGCRNHQLGPVQYPITAMPTCNPASRISRPFAESLASKTSPYANFQKHQNIEHSSNFRLQGTILPLSHR